jgi:hypothetical protein
MVRYKYVDQFGSVDVVVHGGQLSEDTDLSQHLLGEVAIVQEAIDLLDDHLLASQVVDC